MFFSSICGCFYFVDSKENVQTDRKGTSNSKMCCRIFTYESEHKNCPYSPLIFNRKLDSIGLYLSFEKFVNAQIRI